MNIFYLSAYEDMCAQMHCDSHCSKMIIEYAQLMSTAHRVLDGEEYYGRTKNNRRIKRWLHPDAELEDTLYKASHINHPSAIWVRQSRANYRWLYHMWTELNREFMYRYNKNVPHESFRKLQFILGNEPTNLKEGFFTEPTPAMPDDVKEECSVMAYRNYYIKYKQHLAKWTKRGAPNWYEQVGLRTA
jgi:hypothetical protein